MRNAIVSNELRLSPPTWVWFYFGRLKEHHNSCFLGGLCCDLLYFMTLCISIIMVSRPQYAKAWMKKSKLTKPKNVQRWHSVAQWFALLPPSIKGPGLNSQPRGPFCACYLTFLWILLISRSACWEILQRHATLKRNTRVRKMAGNSCLHYTACWWYTWLTESLMQGWSTTALLACRGGCWQENMIQ